MDKLNFVKNGATRLPPGFRFQPTDEEIVFQYLTRKISSLPLPASVVPEISVSKFDPWDLPGDGDEDRYFFTKNEAKYQKGTRTNRATGSGYWKGTGSDKRISCPKRSEETLGMRKTLVFHKGKLPNGSRTDWIMHEYRLVNSGGTSSCNFQNNNSTQDTLVQMGNWVMCRIFLKKRSTEKDDDEEIIQPQPRVVCDFTRRDDFAPNSCSSSASSCGSCVVTKETSPGLDEEESSGTGCHGLSPYLYQ